LINHQKPTIPVLPSPTKLHSIGTNEQQSSAPAQYASVV
jgi:hypothetical protein